MYAFLSCNVESMFQFMWGSVVSCLAMSYVCFAPLHWYFLLWCAFYPVFHEVFVFSAWLSFLSVSLFFAFVLVWSVHLRVLRPVWGMTDTFFVGFPPVHIRMQMGRLAFYGRSVLFVLHWCHSFVSSGLGLSVGGVVHIVICDVLCTLLVVYACAVLVVFSCRAFYTTCFTRFLHHMYCNDGSVLSLGSPQCLMTLAVPRPQYLSSARRYAVITLLETRSEDICCFFRCWPSLLQVCFDHTAPSAFVCVLPVSRSLVCMCCSSCLDSVFFASAFLRYYGYDVCFNLNVCWSKEGSIIIPYMLFLSSEWAIIVHVLIWRELWPIVQLFAVLVALASSACAFCSAAVHSAASYAVGSMYEVYHDSVKLNS